MDEIFDVKIRLSYVHALQKNIEIPLCAKKVILITEFVFCAKILHFYELRENNFAHAWRNLRFFSPSF